MPPRFSLYPVESIVSRTGAFGQAILQQCNDSSSCHSRKLGNVKLRNHSSKEKICIHYIFIVPRKMKLIFKGQLQLMEHTDWARLVSLDPSDALISMWATVALNLGKELSPLVCLANWYPRETVFGYIQWGMMVFTQPGHRLGPLLTLSATTLASHSANVAETVVLEVVAVR